MIAPLLSWLYMESPNQLPFVPDQVFPTSGCCQLGAARLFTSCCRSSSGGNSTGEAAWNPNKCGEFSHQRCGFHILERQNTIFSGQTALTILFGHYGFDHLELVRELLCLPFLFNKMLNNYSFATGRPAMLFWFHNVLGHYGQKRYLAKRMNVRCNDIMTRKTWDLSPNMINGVVLLRKA